MPVSPLKDKTVRDFIEENPMEWIVVKDTDTVAEVLNVLTRHRISSVPVLRSDSGKLIGFVDVLDLVAACVESFPEPHSLSMGSFNRSKQFSKQAVMNVVNFSTRDPPAFVFFQAPLTDLIEKLSQPNIHRVVVVNENQDGIALVTQSKMVEYLHSFKDSADEIKTKMNVPINQLLPSRAVESIHSNDLVVAAFRKIQQKGVSGLAIVNKEGELVGNISASDLKLAHARPISHLIHELFQPLKHFKKLPSKKLTLMEELDQQHTPVCVKTDDIAAVAFEKAVNNKIHRVFVVDAKMHPVNVVALGDLISFFRG
jgi:CBS domain-containing protein